MSSYEVQIELLDGKSYVVMLDTSDRGAAYSYAQELRTRPKWSRNSITVVEVRA